MLIAYADGFKGPTAIGVVLSIGAAIGSAIYKVRKKEDVISPSILISNRIKQSNKVKNYI